MESFQSSFSEIDQGNFFTLFGSNTNERRGGQTGEKSVTLILRKNRPVQHTFEI
jgi:hypothetical protein